ncbi:rhomboid family intramembrane serine protease [Cellulomonas sp.]|uniref:rhomboid family intramembrane serine protease n=1 Tax=Cellulomonas sp. TaxID=40001 RepID=UPI00258CDE88|nr:rhomboid family intramembrane serine protease [Cellulomonas sp.]MCR6688528.1 rhomboid family intramembrane serine protease [Cellulomonas sp.]
MQCVDCVRDAARSTRDVRTRFGGLVHPGARPVVTLAFIALCVVAYLGQWTVDGFTTDWKYSPLRGHAEPWRFLTSAFLHSPGSIFHIVLNMVALWTVGPYLEVQLGRVRYATLYLLSAVGGSVVVLLVAALGWSDWYSGVVGASGAVFGLFGAAFVVMWRSGHPAQGMLGVIGVNMVFSFVVPGISWQGHLGGLVTGALLAAAYAFAPAARRRLVAVVAPALVAAGLAALVGWSYGQAPPEVQQIWDLPDAVEDSLLREWGL